jgi:hypothetical protein
VRRWRPSSAPGWASDAARAEVRLHHPPGDQPAEVFVAVHGPHEQHRARPGVRDRRSRRRGLGEEAAVAGCLPEGHQPYTLLRSVRASAGMARGRRAADEFLDGRRAHQERMGTARHQRDDARFCRSWLSMLSRRARRPA